MKLNLLVQSLSYQDLNLVLNQILSLSQKKGLDARIIRLKTIRKNVPNSDYQIWIHRRILKIKNPSESFAKVFKSLKFPKSVKVQAEVVRKKWIN